MEVSSAPANHDTNNNNDAIIPYQHNDNNNVINEVEDEDFNESVPVTIIPYSIHPASLNLELRPPPPRTTEETEHHQQRLEMRRTHIRTISRSKSRSRAKKEEEKKDGKDTSKEKARKSRWDRHRNMSGENVDVVVEDPPQGPKRDSSRRRSHKKKESNKEKLGDIKGGEIPSPDAMALLESHGKHNKKSSDRDYNANSQALVVAPPKRPQSKSNNRIHRSMEADIDHDNGNEDNNKVYGLELNNQTDNGENDDDLVSETSSISFSSAKMYQPQLSEFHQYYVNHDVNVGVAAAAPSFPPIITVDRSRSRSKSRDGCQKS